MKSTFRIFGRTYTFESNEELYKKLMKVLSLHEPRITSRGMIAGEVDCTKAIKHLMVDMADFGIKCTVTYRNGHRIKLSDGMDMYVWF